MQELVTPYWGERALANPTGPLCGHEADAIEIHATDGVVVYCQRCERVMAF